MKKVIVLGGGVAGLSAAHELSERNFGVAVYERKSIPGGKARSINVPNTAIGDRLPLPGEHGFRFFPRFYKHITDTMKRIPDKKHGGSVLHNLVQADRAEMAEYDKAPIKVITRFPRDANDLKAIIAEIHENNTGLTKDDFEFFGGKLWKLMTSSFERRQAEYEKVSWWDFVEAGSRSKTFQTYLAIGLTRTLVAAKATEISAKTGGDILLQLIFDMTTPGVSSDRLLNGPTNDVFINPLVAQLKERGVDYQKDAYVKKIYCDETQITGVDIEIDGQIQRVEGDYYISAMPVEVMADMITPAMVGIDPHLQDIKPLSDHVSWMNGIQFYLNEDLEIVHGHTIYINSEWALTSISQAQFWKDYPMENFGAGNVKTVLSVDISDWESKGNKIKKTAMDCSPEEIKEEVLHQLKKSLNVEGKNVLREDMVVDWFLDPDIQEDKKGPHSEVNMEPLLINAKNTWDLRPDAVTGIPNFFLASDYVRTYTDLATMEGANEAARRAVNGILRHSGSNEQPCELWKLHEPFELKYWRERDRKRFEKGLPWDGKVPGRIFSAVLWLFSRIRRFFERPRILLHLFMNFDMIINRRKNE